MISVVEGFAQPEAHSKHCQKTYADTNAEKGKLAIEQISPDSPVGRVVGGQRVEGLDREQGRKGSK